MQTIIIIGNSQTYEAGGYMITPRGYLNKYELTDQKT
jgi:precorrin-3B C17-methyltransferase